MSDPRPELLSPTGLARREAMLDELCEVVRQTHRTRRRRRRIVGTGGSLCLLMILAWLSASSAFGPDDTDTITRNPTVPSPVAEPHEAPVRPRFAIRTVATDPTVMDRYHAKATGAVVRMDDRMLLDTLASIGRPAGLIRFGGQVRLTSAVTDFELAVRQ